MITWGQADKGAFPISSDIRFGEALEAAGINVLRAFILDGPEHTERRDDGSGIIIAAGVTVEVPANTLWVEVRPLTDADIDAAEVRAGRPSKLGAVLDAQLGDPPDLGPAALRLIDEWTADHRIELKIVRDHDLSDADASRAEATALEAASRNLARRIAALSSMPFHGDVADALAAWADCDELPGEVQALLGRLVGERRLTEDTLSDREFGELQRYRQRNRRLRDERARLALVRCLGGPWDGIPPAEHWQRLDQMPRQQRRHIIDEVDTIATRGALFSGKGDAQ